MRGWGGGGSFEGRGYGGLLASKAHKCNYVNLIVIL